MMDAVWKCYVGYVFWVRSFQGTPGEFLTAYIPIAALIAFACFLARRRLKERMLMGEPQETAKILLGLLWLIGLLPILTSVLCLTCWLLLPSFSYRICLLLALPSLIVTMLSSGAALDLLSMLYWQLEESERQSSGWRNVFRLIIFTLILVCTSIGGLLYGSVATNLDTW